MEIGVNVMRMPRFFTYRACYFVAAFLTTLLTGCNEAKVPEATAVAQSSANALKVAPAFTGASLTAHAAPPATPRFSEPGLTAKLVDTDSKQPLAGALVYGYYATVEGTVGGERLAQVVRGFATETDANGVFNLAAWDTGAEAIKGEPRSRFPMIAIFKPGYQVEYQTLKSLQQWRSNARMEGRTYRLNNNVYDWTAYPFELTATKTEKERYTALTDANDGMMFVGDCGWEVYSKVLLAQHNELKDWYRRNLPPESLDQNGYMKGTAQKPKEFWAINTVFETTVDRLLANYSAKLESAKCSDPRSLFKEKK
jgi:hypothetical protein